MQLNDQKQQTLLKSTAILTISMILVKIIGFVFTIPLINLLGGEGMGYFYTAYDIYSFITAFFLTGLPIAVTKMVSESTTLEHTDITATIFREAYKIFFVLGFVSSVCMYFFSNTLADLINNPNAALSIKALSPMVFFAAILAVYRGYFQGKSNMIPTAITQIIEAICKLAFGVGIAFVFIQLQYSYEIASAGAIAGVSISSLCAIVYIVIYKKHKEKTYNVRLNKTNRTDIVKKLIVIAIPITLSSLLFSLISLIDTAIILNRLQLSGGLSYQEANWLFGIYGNAKKIYNLPVSLIIPLSTSIVPAIVSAAAEKKKMAVHQLTERALKLTALFAVPSGIGIILLARPIFQLIYFGASSEIAVGSPLLAILGVSVVFSSLVLVTTSILQALGKSTYAAITMVIGGILKVCMCWILVGNKNIGILGAPISTAFCYFVTSLLNIIPICIYAISLKKAIKQTMKIILCAAIMGASAYGLNYIGLLTIQHEKIVCLISIGCAALIYLVLVVKTGVVESSEMRSIPIINKLLDSPRRNRHDR